MVKHTLVIRVGEQSLLNQIQLLLKNIQIDLILLVQELDQLAPIVPRTVVGKVGTDLLVCEFQFVSSRQISTLDHEGSVAPAMEISLVRLQEQAAQFQLVWPA